MLEIKNITKDYSTGSDSVHALRGVSIAFRNSELVAILGHSGCGKTTLLNIIGGLDRYTSGDLIIDGRSTKQYKDRDWDTYRNHSIGFIFQSYNLIPHQSVLSNVELALTLSGVSKAERRRRAKEALEKVGLGDQINKRPNQMSGGQMQRVAIARALVNDPEILLADEPTGALDSETSIQIMELVKEIAKDRLVIMVTHNPDLANDYATRIVKLVDGEIKSDSDPFDPAADKPEAAEKKPKKSNNGKKTKMSFLTALSLSRNNLMTKKGRTFLTSFAGSIGIIGIALILSLSNGVQQYIDSVEHSTLASYPVQLDRKTVDYSGIMSSMMNTTEDNKNEEREPDRVYTNDMSTQMMKTMMSEIKENNLNEFMDYLETNPGNIKDCISEIKYGYKSKLYVFGHDKHDGKDGEIMRVNPSTAITAMLGEEMAGTMSSMWGTMSMFSGSDMNDRANCFEQLLSNDRVNEQYEIVAGRLPEDYNEVVVIISENNEISNMTLYTLGLLDQNELSDMMSHIMAGEVWDIETGNKSFSYDDLMKLTFTALTPSDMFKKNDEGGYDDMTADQDFMTEALKNGTELKVVGVIRPNSDSMISANSMGGIGYTAALTEHMINAANESELVKLQQDNPGVDIFTGIEFPKEDEKPDETMSQEEAMQQLMGFMSQEQLTEMFQTVLQTLTPEQQAEVMQPSSELFDKLTELAAPEAMSNAVMSVLTPQQMQQLQEMTNPSGSTAMSQEEAMEKITETMSDEQRTMMFQTVMQTLTPEQQAEITQMSAQQQFAKLAELAEPNKLTGAFMSVLTQEQMKQMAQMTQKPEETKATYDGNLEILGVDDLTTPDTVYIYAKDFDSKERLSDFISEYNQMVKDDDREDDVINYTDYIGMMISGVTDTINAISYILIAFVAISLVVSSIMIGIITYISVLERTKEIGILRAMGASKRDISNVFNAETLIVGFAAGVIGILVTVLMNIPINIIIVKLTDIANMSKLPPIAGAALVVISMLLTLIAGLFPASVAAKKDPVIALRTE